MYKKVIPFYYCVVFYYMNISQFVSPLTRLLMAIWIVCSFRDYYWIGNLQSEALASHLSAGEAGLGVFSKANLSLQCWSSVGPPHADTHIHLPVHPPSTPLTSPHAHTRAPSSPPEHTGRGARGGPGKEAELPLDFKLRQDQLDRSPPPPPNSAS